MRECTMSDLDLQKLDSHKNSVYRYSGTHKNMGLSCAMLRRNLTLDCHNVFKVDNCHQLMLTVIRVEKRWEHGEHAPGTPKVFPRNTQGKQLSKKMFG